MTTTPRAQAPLENCHLQDVIEEESGDVIGSKFETTTRRDRYVLLQVTDTGTGMTIRQ